MKTHIEEFRKKYKKGIGGFWIRGTCEAIDKDIEEIIPKTFGCNRDLGRALCGEISVANNIILCDECTMKLINKFEEIKQIIRKGIK